MQEVKLKIKNHFLDSVEDFAEFNISLLQTGTP